MQWTEFEKPSGRVVQVLEGNSLVPPAETESLGRLDDVMLAGDAVYVDVATRDVLSRPASSIGLTQVGGIVSLTNVHSGTTVRVTGDLIETVLQDDVDGHLEITFAGSGTYTLSAEQFPELPFSASVTVE